MVARSGYSRRRIFETLEDFTSADDISDGRVAFDEQIGNVCGQVDARGLQPFHIRGYEIHAPVRNKDIDHGLVCDSIWERSGRATSAWMMCDGLENLNSFLEIFGDTAPCVDKGSPV